MNSTAVAFIVAPLCLVLGTLAAFGLTRFRFRGRGRRWAGSSVRRSILPWLLIGIAALMAYSRANINLSLRTVIATQTICTFPLVTAIVAAQLFRFQKVQEEAAIDLGCSRLQVLRHIILPHIGPALAAAAIFAFTWSFNNYEISAFTIGFQQTFPVWVYSSVRNPDHTAIVNAISALISLGQVLLIWFALRLMRVRIGGHASHRDDRRHRGRRGDGEDVDGCRRRVARDRTPDRTRCPARTGRGPRRPGGAAGPSASCSPRSPSSWCCSSCRFLIMVQMSVVRFPPDVSERLHA